MATRRFLYIDLDSFFACCEILQDRQLLALPFAVGGAPQQRGVVSSASYAARVHGVRSGMPMSRAVKLCPELRVISPHFDAYRRRSQAVMDYLRSVSTEFEQRSIDEAVLDITALYDDSAVLAQRIQGAIRERFLLPCSLGVANTIRTSKIAVEVGKQHGMPGKVPQAITVVREGTERQFLAPLKVGIMPGIGPKMQASLLVAGITTLGDLAHWPMHEMQRRFGGYGLTVQRYAQGIDPAAITTTQQRKAISQEHTFAQDIVDEAPLREMMQHQATNVSLELQAKGMYARVVKLKLRWDDFTTVTRQATLARPTDQAVPLIQAALLLFAQTWDAERPVRLIGVGVHGLQHTRQLRLWDTGENEEIAFPHDHATAQPYPLHAYLPD